ncbi:secretory phospholipase A2 receptor-like [Gambusia affinis]|uniref:secretory phospholipase A2 receptor-like n=1 Tax=Gambusia affinis TaxID=33528 RepID=UPI001CDD64AB|nr:secretory phospholipase A2 receptor-like [Gambusia affinis]
MQWSLILLFLMAQCCFIDCQLYTYHYINQNKNWTEAQQYCREKHTDLVTVTNMKDMERLKISAGGQSEAWIGLYDPTNGPRTWYWSLTGVEFNEKTNTTHKYHLIKELKTWQEAQSYCREKHTDLISGTKQLEDEEVKKLMISSDHIVYFGLFRDTWRWSDGSSFSFRHWNLKFNNQIINRGQCAMTVFDDGGRWRNENCNERKPFICYEDKVILIKENKTWLEALTYCRDHHDDLVTITNMDDQILIQEKAKEASTPFVWLGLFFSCLKNKWFWVCKNNPNLERRINNCGKSGAMEAGGKHMWFQGNSTEKLNFFCLKR